MPTSTTARASVEATAAAHSSTSSGVAASSAATHAGQTTTMTSLATVLAAAALLQMSSACKNCVVLGKAEKAMFRAHSDACLAQSGAAPRAVAALLAGGGELAEDAALRRHVYCVLLKCKVVGKDGKLLKTAVLGKLAMRPDGKNATKILENCADQSTDQTPEDAAWNLFRCGYDRKAVLFDYMPTDKQTAADVA